MTYYEKRLKFSIDILSDGSEYTGHGTLFLTVERLSSYSAKCNENDINVALGTTQIGNITVREDGQIDDISKEAETGTIVAKYAICGVATLTTRLCTDQSMKLSHIRAILCPSTDIMSTAGIPSLLLSLSNYSIPGTLAVIGPAGMNEYMADMADLVLGVGRQHPKISTCEVPMSKDSSDVWWKVLEDEYIIVHARCYSPIITVMTRNSLIDSLPIKPGASASTIIYILSLRPNNKNSYEATTSQRQYSFAIFPPDFDSTQQSYVLDTLPESIKAPCNRSSSITCKPLLFILLCNPHKRSFSFKQDELLLHVDSKLDSLTNYYMATVPNRNNEKDVSIDDGLLIRAIHQSTHLHSILPFAFPLRSYDKRIENQINANSNVFKEHTLESTKRVSLDSDKALICSCYRLRSCTSVILCHVDKFCNSASIDGSFSSKCPLFCIENRKESLWRLIQSQTKPTYQECYQDSPCKNDNHDKSHENDKSYDVSSMMKELQQLFESGHCERAQVAVDENEIDLEDSCGDSHPLPSLHGHKEQIMQSDCADVSVTPSHNLDSRKRKRYSERMLTSKREFRPHILILGTGCATPAPLRGSSGYALLLPAVNQDNGEHYLALTGLIECGEGSLMSLSRYMPSHSSISFQEQLARLKWIWISHAHIDHYADLPSWIHIIHKIRELSHGLCEGKSQCLASGQQYGFCSHCNGYLPVLIIAPEKVLRYLDLSLHKKGGSVNRSVAGPSKRLFLGITQTDYQQSPFAQTLRDMFRNFDVPTHTSREERPHSSGFQQTSIEKYTPFYLVRNIPVEHCKGSFALVLGIETALGKLIVCFSGDTRPCRALVEFSNKEYRMTGQRINLLIHEATFDDDKHSDAMAKSHSTISEALDIFRASAADSCILTHFSQRYPRLPPGTNSLTAGYGRAVDGMMIPLHQSVLSKLPLLDYCIWKGLEQLCA